MRKRDPDKPKVLMNFSGKINIDGVELQKPVGMRFRESTESNPSARACWSYKDPVTGKETMLTEVLSKYKSRRACWDAMLRRRREIREKIKKEHGINLP